MNQVNDVVVFLWGDDDDESITKVAAEFAERSGAHLTGFFVFSDMPESILKNIAPPQAVREAYSAHAKQMTDRCRTRFQQALENTAVKASFFARTGNVLELMQSRARSADVVVIRSQRDAGLRHRQTLINDALITTGAPFLILPPDASRAPVAKRVVIGWNGSRESALAVRTSMDLLRAAEIVCVVSVADENGSELGVEVDLCEHLVRHGVNVEARHSSAGDVVENMTEVADDIMADLIICGAWGHSRLREIIVGGVTRKLLQHGELAVWMMH